MLQLPFAPMIVRAFQALFGRSTAVAPDAVQLPTPEADPELPPRAVRRQVERLARQEASREAAQPILRASAPKRRRRNKKARLEGKRRSQQRIQNLQRGAA